MKEYTILELQQLMDIGRITAQKLVKNYLSRINQIDKAGPQLNAIIEINPDVIKIARELDHERKTNGVRGPLHGIPIVIKDNIDTADKMKTSAGSLALMENKPVDDAFIVKKLRAAGAIILGKTNLSEWANFRSSKSTSGWSSRGGLTRNPYILDRSACGSSSGSAVAVAANLCLGAIGTETDGSIICPSQTNGIVGIKPSLGLVSRSGIIPIAHSQDTAGPMARTVEDAAILLGIIAGEDKSDHWVVANKASIYDDYTQFLDSCNLKGIRLGVARIFFGFNDKVDEIMEKAIKKLENLDAIIVDPANIETTNDFRDAEYEVLLFEFKHDLNDYLAKHQISYKTLKEIIDYNNKNHNEVMPYFKQEHFLKAEEKGSLTSIEYNLALEVCKRLARKEGIDATIAKHQLDAIIAPSGGPAWPIDLLNGDHHSGGSSSPAAVSGYPNITVPVGYIHGLPIGISFFGTAYQEPILLKIAYAFEQATKIRQPPLFKPTLAFH